MTGDARWTPLAEVSGDLAAVAGSSGGALRLTELAARTLIDVRVDPVGPACALVEKVLDSALPLEPNTSARAGERHVLWLGPDEWLLVDPPGDTAIEHQLREAVAGQHVSLVDVSAARTVVEIAGREAGALLAHGCALDLHPDVFVPGSCAQTRLALANVVIFAPPGQAAEDPLFWVFVRSSFASYLATWLLDAALEFATK